MGLVPAGAYRNRSYSGEHVETGDTEECYLDLLYDPQTSGGLLFSVSADDAQALVESLENAQMDTKMSVIGTVKDKMEKLIYVQ